MCLALFPGILSVKDKLDTVTAPKSLRSKRGEGENILMKNPKRRQNVAGTLREHGVWGGGRAEEGGVPSGWGWRRLGKQKNQWHPLKETALETLRSAGGHKSLGVQGMKGREFIKQSASFISFSVSRIINEPSITTSILCFP